MKYINKWFTPEDFINLMAGKKNREVILRDTIVYIDTEGTKIFIHDNVGKMLDSPKGNKGPASTKVMTFSEDQKAFQK